MQLQMTAPLDIGLEQHDAALGIGQEDMFDLGDAERDMGMLGGVSDLMGEESDLAGSEEGETMDDEQDASDGLDSEDDAERKVAMLEAEMDQMYDIYQTRMRERDAKYKVREARKKKSERLGEWHGVREEASEEEASDDEGGWETMQEAKEGDGEDLSSEDSDDDADEDISDRKRGRGDEGGLPQVSKRARLVTKLQDRNPTAPSRVAQVWFSQDVFSGIDGLDVDDDQNAESDMSDVEAIEEQHSNVSPFLSYPMYGCVTPVEWIWEGRHRGSTPGN
jgi:AdoMet-dependent rRNA methyltransferase SPB1